MRLFLEASPREDLADHLKSLLRAGKGKLLLGGVAEMNVLLADFFPYVMAVSDACLTNADFLWFHKHSYL